MNSNFFLSQTTNEEILEIQSELLNENIDTLSNYRHLEELSEIDKEYEIVKRNIEDLYFKLKIELWTYKLEVKISSFTNSKFYLDVSYKSKIQQESSSLSEAIIYTRYIQHIHTHLEYI